MKIEETRRKQKEKKTSTLVFSAVQCLKIKIKNLIQLSQSFYKAMMGVSQNFALKALRHVWFLESLKKKK